MEAPSRLGHHFDRKAPHSKSANTENPQLSSFILLLGSLQRLIYLSYTMPQSQRLEWKVIHERDKIVKARSKPSLRFLSGF